MQPLITIGMPVFNDVDFIEESIESVRVQTFSNWQMIISDDGSTDGSQKICEQFAKLDDRITYIRQVENLGISKNMQFLLKQANTKYFMWAGDDDLYDKYFIEKCISVLESHSDAVSAFATMAKIDENGNLLENSIDNDYRSNHRFGRLIGYIRNATDYFGYGIFRTDKIKGVKFPVWWWPNKKSPYNNIYPTLCYYLAKGNYIHVKGLPLFYKRTKTGANVHHVLTGENNAIKESFAYWIRKFNLVCFSFQQIRRASSIFISISVSPALFYYWFMVPSWKQFLLAAGSFFKNRFKQ
ncbi:MAG: glycosyltransferase family 2 protein [bacterium]